MLRIIFCALNEAKSLPKFLGNITKTTAQIGLPYEIVICLDGTSDNSLQVVEQWQQNFPIRALPLQNQRGLGLAYKRIFIDLIHKTEPNDLIISLDADNTHDPSGMINMIKQFQRDNLDVLIASRFVEKSSMTGFPLRRQLISKTTSLVLQTLFGARLISGKKLRDYTSGYRIYRSAILQKIFTKESEQFVTETEFTYTCELLIKLSRIDARIDETSFPYDYSQKIGASKLNFWRNLKCLLLLIPRLLLLSK